VAGLVPVEGTNWSATEGILSAIYDGRIAPAIACARKKVGRGRPAEIAVTDARAFYLLARLAIGQARWEQNTSAKCLFVRMRDALISIASVVVIQRLRARRRGAFFLLARPRGGILLFAAQP
jgi:hypothetical protein